MNRVSPAAFLQQGLRIMSQRQERADSLRKFKAHFGATLYICAMLWLMVLELPHAQEPILPRNSTSFAHLLWGLLFMKV